MEQHHIIETALVEISFASEDEAFEVNGGIESFVNESLLPVVEDVFNEMTRPDTVIRIEQLVVDLGQVEHRAYRDELPRRLRERLRKVLKEQIEAHNSQTSSSCVFFKKEQMEMDMVEHCLVHGCLPWYAPVKQKLNLEQLLGNLIRTNGRRVVNFLKNSPLRATVVERLVRQFDGGRFYEILSLLTPLHKNALCGLAHELDARPSGYTLWQSVDRLQKLRIKLLSALLETDGVLFDPIAFWTRSLEQSLPSNSASRQLMKVTTSNQELSEKIEYWRLLLMRAFSIGDAEYVEKIWSLLIRKYPALVAAVLRESYSAVNGNGQLARRFPERMLWDLITVLEPTEHRFIVRLISRPNWYYKQEWVGADIGAEKARRTLWQFTLSYLLVERGGQFNKKAYLDSLITQMAANENSTADILLHSFRSSLELVEMPSDLKRELLQWLRELTTEHSASMWVKQPPPVSPADSNMQMSQHDWLNEDAKVKAWLTNELMSAVTIRIELLWPLLVQEHAQLLKECLNHCGQYARIRHNIAVSFPRAIVRDICGLLESDTWPVTTIGILSRHPDWFQSGIEVATVENLESTFYEFTLTYLLVERGSQFNRKAYLGSLLLQMSAHNNLRYEDLLNSMTSAVEKAGVSAEVKEGLLQVLYDLQGEVNSAQYENTGVSAPDKQVVSLGGLHADLSNLSPDVPGPPGKEVVTIRREREKQGSGQLLRAAEKERVTKDRMTPDESLVKVLTDDNENQEYTEQVYIQNAGLVLTSPYLPLLFSRLGLIVNNDFIDRESAERAIHVLQYLAYGQTTSPEYQLVLNKVLCGVHTGKPIMKTMVISRDLEEIVEGMLQAIITNWSAIGNTTITGLRESFLQREGRLVLKDNGWHLLVEQRAFDMLLDRLPWSYGTIRHPWMERVLNVEWR